MGHSNTIITFSDPLMFPHWQKLVKDKHFIKASRERKKRRKKSSLYYLQLDVKFRNYINILTAQLLISLHTVYLIAFKRRESETGMSQSWRFLSSNLRERNRNNANVTRLNLQDSASTCELGTGQVTFWLERKLYHKRARIFYTV